jgi:hypothetical protein
VEGLWLSQPDPVGAWLDVMMGLVRLGGAEKRAIRDELDSHLRDRVRDLMLAGAHESEATRVAIAELGDAAELALRFGRASRGPARRRLAMNIGMLGMAGAALVTSMVALVQPGGQQAGGQAGGPQAGVGGDGGAGAVLDMKGMRVFSPSPWEKPAEGASVVVKIDAMDEVPLGEALRRIASAAGLALVVDPDVKRIDEGRGVSCPAMEHSLAGIFAVIAAEAGWNGMAAGERLDYRVSGGTMRVAFSGQFDREESVLVILDLHDAIMLGASEMQLVEAVTTFVEPDLWVHNGGDIGRVMVVGQKLFVKAPPRMIEGVRWIVQEAASVGLGAGEDAAVRGEGREAAGSE